MRRFLALALVLFLASPSHGAPRVPPPELLGLRLGMSDLDAQRRLVRVGQLSETQPESTGRKQIWKLRHRKYQTVNLVGLWPA